MIWVPDNTGRFRERPHYEPEELDVDCEGAVEAVLIQRHGKIEYPVSTDDLLCLLEQVACVDAYVDFEPEAADVWGESEFIPGEIPRVRIKRNLTEEDRYENPRRTTIAHEYGHVRYHGPLFELNLQQGSMFGDASKKTWVCKRQHVRGQRKPDWAEWQAAYCSGALVMPKRALTALMTDFLRKHSLVSPQIDTGTLEEIEVISAITGRFLVSRIAATVRLKQLRFLIANEAGQHKLDI